MTPRLKFDNRFLRELPGDAETGSRRREVLRAAWSQVMPGPVAAPRLLAHAPDVAAMLGFDDAAVQAPDFAAVFAGNALYDGMQPWAANYGGHQFGHWAGQLGDGRAISLGELLAGAGSCSSRARDRRRTRAGPMAVRCCARRYANSCVRKPCTTSGCRPRGP